MSTECHEFGSGTTCVAGRGLPVFKTRILVAGESKEWRDEVCRMLQPLTEPPVIIETSGASQAIQKARELAPEIVVLDIGMPNLNGIEAARQIRQQSPHSRVVVLTQSSDEEVVGWVLCYSRAHGCVVKADAANKLCPAITTALQ